ncbi:hypothetical protein Lesp02_54160 [Lentzea sp. NBRC 105346]|uniref:DUF2784 domain-containing protein n=1 Tax=Lentzea sp. NBRC 105346 TaxID=3032205 RepID=UPI0024A3CC2B|nr:DUF2784 domain-containing protein [Lentzea sp. NBRC 105346]GLZ33228.1 hypothetical protein Lesp02_54160 [Lentzea sp. NBRC 105346]
MARVLADTVMVLHFALMGFLIVGGFFAWRWRGVIYPHLVIGAWAILSLLVDVKCPLTMLENHFRLQAGQPELSGGFIDHYIDGVWYPESQSAAVQFVLGTIVIVSWVGFAARTRSGHKLSFR